MLNLDCYSWNVLWCWSNLHVWVQLVIVTCIEVSSGNYAFYGFLFAFPVSIMQWWANCIDHLFVLFERFVSVIVICFSRVIYVMLLLRVRIFVPFGWYSNKLCTHRHVLYNGAALRLTLRELPLRKVVNCFSYCVSVFVVSSSELVDTLSEYLSQSLALFMSHSSLSYLIKCYVMVRDISSQWPRTLAYTVKPVYNDHLMGYLSAFWSSSRWPLAT